MGKNLIAIVGPTATGKTSLAARLACDLDGEILSADSRQVYRHMDIGTGKDRHQYAFGAKTVSVHLIDIIDPEAEFTVYDFQKQFYTAYADVAKRGKWPILVGGTGLYLESVLGGYILPEAPPDPALRKALESKSLGELQQMLLSMTNRLHNKTDLEDRERILRRIEIEQAKRKPSKIPVFPEIRPLVFGIRLPRPVLREKIALRLAQRLNEGMIEEVARLHEKGLSWERLDGFGLEYRFISRFLKGEMTKRDMISKLEIAIGQFAKRQETWFRRMERKGQAIVWIDPDYEQLKEKVLEAIYESSSAD